MGRTWILALATLAGGCMMTEPAELSATGESELARALEGRAAGPAMTCVSQRTLGSSRSIDNDLLLFEGAGDVVYVNRPAGGCASLAHGRALSTRTTASQLCRGDIVTVFDPVSGVELGGCGLGDFVPWRRVR